jgi:hypothetical protein
VLNHFPQIFRSGEVTSVSGLWTPSGEHVPEPDPASSGSAASASLDDGLDDGLDDELDPEVAEELRRVRAEIAATPVEDLVARHAVGLWELAVLHLSPDEDRPLRLDQAAVAIDAMGGIVDTLGDRLGAHASALRDALGQLRLAFVEVQQRATSGE